MSRGKRHTPEQIVVRLREADALLNAGQSLGQVIQHLGVSEATYHRWRNQYGGMKAEEAKRLKALEDPGDTHNRACQGSPARGSAAVAVWSLVFFLTTVVAVGRGRCGCRLACLAHTHSHRIRDAAADRA